MHNNKCNKDVLHNPTHSYLDLLLREQDENLHNMKHVFTKGSVVPWWTINLTSLVTDFFQLHASAYCDPAGILRKEIKLMLSPWLHGRTAYHALRDVCCQTVFLQWSAAICWVRSRGSNEIYIWFEASIRGKISSFIQSFYNLIHFVPSGFAVICWSISLVHIERRQEK